MEIASSRRAGTRNDNAEVAILIKITSTMIKSIEKKIKKVNQLLIGYYGIPPRPDVPPDPVDMLIATILSQNTNDRNSYKAFQNLKEKYKTWDEAAKQPRHKIESLIKVAGLGKQKSAAIKNFNIRP